MPIELYKRGDIYHIRGTVRGRRCRETTGTSSREHAEAYRAKKEAELYDATVFGERAVVSFRRAALSYLDFEPRSQRTKDYVAQLVDHFGDTRLGKITQSEADKAVGAIVGHTAAPATKTRVVYTPLTAILSHSAKRDWCVSPHFDKPKPSPGKTRWLTPAEAETLISGASPHLKPLLIFYLCTGARVTEALDLDWADVDLAAGKVVFRGTKNDRDRPALLPRAAWEALANYPLREGKVFRTDDGDPYTDRERWEGGQIRTSFRTALRRAQIVTPTTPHDLRHTWATYFYCLSKDLLLLKDEGGWKTLTMVERYAHLMPSDLASQIARVWGGNHPRIDTSLTQRDLTQGLTASIS